MLVVKCKISVVDARILLKTECNQYNVYSKLQELQTILILSS